MPIMKLKVSQKLVILHTIILCLSLFLGWPRVLLHNSHLLSPQSVWAANYLQNPSFTGGTNGWTLTTSTYDSTYYQDSAGSLATATLVGRNKSAIGTAQQTITTQIGANDTVLLSLYWSKQCVSTLCDINTVQIDIEKPSQPGTWLTIWSDTSIPAAGSKTSWAGPSNLDVSSYFDETGQYSIRTLANLDNPNDPNSQALAWIDNINLDVTTNAVVSVSVSDGVITYGTRAASASATTLSGDLNDMQTATNDGNVTENFNIRGQDATGGGCTWTLSNQPGADLYVHQFCNASDSSCTSPPTNYTTLTTSYQTLKTGIPTSSSVNVHFRLITPTGSSCYNEQTVDITIQAVQQ